MFGKFITYLSLLLSISISCYANSSDQSIHNKMISDIDESWKGQKEIVFRSYKLDKSLSDLIVATANDSDEEPLQSADIQIVGLLTTEPTSPSSA